jgi:hypothetical protein
MASVEDGKTLLKTSEEGSLIGRRIQALSRSTYQVSKIIRQLTIIETSTNTPRISSVLETLLISLMRKST